MISKKAQVMAGEGQVPEGGGHLSLALSYSRELVRS